MPELTYMERQQFGYSGHSHLDDSNNYLTEILLPNMEY